MYILITHTTTTNEDHQLRADLYNIYPRVRHVEFPVVVEARFRKHGSIERGYKDTHVGESAEMIFKQACLGLRRIHISFDLELAGCSKHHTSLFVSDWLSSRSIRRCKELDFGTHRDKVAPFHSLDEPLHLLFFRYNKVSLLGVKRQQTLLCPPTTATTH